MASWNHLNGTSPYYPPSNSTSSQFLAGPGSSDQPRSHIYSPSPTYSYQPATHANLPITGRLPNNVPTNANGAPAFPQQQQWNPAQLLNPRGFNSNPLNVNGMSNSISNNAPNNANLAFQFDSPGGSPHSSYVPTPSPSNDNMMFTTPTNGNGFAGYANGNGQMGGMGHMLERMHNVADRDMMPQKRRKIVDEREQQGKGQFNGGGKGGVLGLYMREQKEEGRKQAAAKGTAPVDISIEDDDVEIVGDDENKEVCFGRVEGAEINAFKVPTPKAGTVAVSSGFWPQVKIVLRRRHGDKTSIIHAVDSTREIIGCIDVSTALGLTPILDSNFGIRTASRILTRQRKSDDPQPGTEISCRFPLDLNIYGPKRRAMQVGRYLSQKQLWLRTPLFVEAGVELHNPHTIQRPPQPPPRTFPSSGGYGARAQGPARTTEEIRNDIVSMFDSLERSENLQEMEADPRITTELLKHQKQGLYFMTNKEKERVFDKDEKGNSSLWRLNISASGQKTYYNVITGHEEKRSPPQVLGGILADMMGLGKTLAVLALVVQTLDVEAIEWSKQQPCPVKDDRDLCPARRGKGAALPKLEQTPLVLNVKATLLVAPVSTIANWEQQMNQHVKPGTLKYHIYHGPNRIKDVKKLAEFDLVITTYGSIGHEFKHRSQKKNGIYPLEEINWFRIVLDEAHIIREQSTQQSKSICRLAANRRWAVTGTPVQNRLEDLGALMAFLRIKPFDEKGGFAQYIMAPFKMCDPEILPKLRLLVDSITLRRLKDRIDLPARRDHLVKLDFSDEERAIYEIFAKNANDRVKVIVGQREKNVSGGKTYVHILQSILRLRLICAHGKDLLSEEDLNVMNGLSKDSAIDLDSDDEDDRPVMSAKQAYDMYNLMKETNADVCLLCSRKVGPSEGGDPDTEAKDEVIGHMTPCYHIICTTCINRYKAEVEGMARGQSFINCPICEQYIKLFYFPLKQGGVEEEEESRLKSKKDAKHGKDINGYSGPHTKTKALIQDLLASRRESELMPDEAPIKSVVLSGWTAHLDLIQLALDENGIPYTRLDGKMSRIARAQAMDAFRDDPSILVILVSITAGGLGLNLTSANKVYVMEPQYNPAAEAQAVDRVHRLGQKREVETVRYIMNDSFEEKMMELQDKKKKLAHLSMDSEARGRFDKAELAKKRLDELRSLFK